MPMPTRTSTTPIVRNTSWKPRTKRKLSASASSGRGGDGRAARAVTTGWFLGAAEVRPIGVAARSASDAGPGEDQRHRPIGDDHHRFEPAKIAVHAPVLGELDRRPHQLVGILLELLLEPLEERKGVRGRPGETADHGAASDRANLFGVLF